MENLIFVTYLFKSVHGSDKMRLHIYWKDPFYSRQRQQWSTWAPNLLHIWKNILKRKIGESVNLGYVKKGSWLLITYLFITVHGSDKMSLSAIVCGWILIKRALGIFICSFVDDFSKTGVTGDFGGVRSRDWLFNDIRIPFHSNGNCDRRGRFLISRKQNVC